MKVLGICYDYETTNRDLKWLFKRERRKEIVDVHQGVFSFKNNQNFFKSAYQQMKK